MKNWLGYLFVVAFLAMPLMGCETMEGAGRDVQKAGEELEDAAD